MQPSSTELTKAMPRDMKTVYCVAWEYVNPGPSAGGGGFDWFLAIEDADKAWAKATSRARENDAVFRFDYPGVDTAASRDAITYQIDGDLIDMCATATTRKVGSSVLAYWKANDFKMGDADGPAR